jgi:hypothetical protein
LIGALGFGPLGIGERDIEGGRHRSDAIEKRFALEVYRHVDDPFGR